MEESWRLQMGVYNLTNGAEQPFYNVLADDESCRYASQGMIIFAIHFYPAPEGVFLRQREAAR